LAVHAEHDGGISGTFVDVVYPKGSPFAVIDLGVVGREGIAGKVFKLGVGGSQGFHEGGFSGSERIGVAGEGYLSAC
jgi:hypothetical protein